MGNQLAGIAPQQIHPVEYYLSDLTNTELLSFDANLGSTRFLKVARVKLHQTRPAIANNNGNYNGFGPPSLAVAKVFVIHDPSLPIKVYQEKLVNLQAQLNGNANALSFSKVILSEKAGIMLRQYIKYNLYDRLSTRPFLTYFEKRWLLYQILKCMQWLHGQRICHGDLKLENILITSNLWVLITDFAPFKPTTLPDDNPGDFSYYFDTSRRRTCNLAPERFLSDCDENLDPNETQLTPQMDLFSLGCVIAELFSDENNFELFDLSSLLAYRKQTNKEEIKAKLAKAVKSPDIISLVENLIDIDQGERLSTTQHLQELTPKIFPKYFQLIFDYFREFVNFAPDEKISRLNADLHCLQGPIVQEDSNGLLLILTMVTSSLRSLKHVHAKITGLRLIVSIINCDAKVMSCYVLDRVLPYLLNLLSDPSSSVRSEAIETLSAILDTVESVPSSDNNVFPDYILTYLGRLVNDKSQFVRMTLSANLTKLAIISKRFLDNSTDLDSTEKTKELEMLRETYQSIISYLLTDQDNGVRRTLLNTEITKLCEFLGHQRTNDVILSHIITFLNNKQDFELRASFFDNIVQIAKFLGQQCSKILKPLLQQGLSDCEETVIYKTLLSLSYMTKDDALNKQIIFELMQESIPLLCHPNLWIRHSLVAFIVALTHKLTLAEVNCKLIPLIKCYLLRELHLLTDELLLDSLKPQIDRELFNLIVYKSSLVQIEQLLDCLKEKKLLRSLPRHHQQGANANYTFNQSQLYQRLATFCQRNQATVQQEDLEDQLLSLGDIIKRIAKNSSKNSLMNEICDENQTGVVILSKKSRKLQRVQLNDNEKISQLKKNSSFNTLSDDFIDDNNGILIAKEAINEEREASKECPPCASDLNNLINHKKESHELAVWSRGENWDNKKWGSIISGAQKPKGILIAHMHEHSKGINKMIAIPKSSLFVTGAGDGLIKTWDCSKIEAAKAPINKAKQTTPSSDSSAIESLCFMPAIDSLVAITSKDVLHIYRLDSASQRLKLVQTQNLTDHDASNEHIINCTDLTTTTPFSFMVAFSNSSLCSFDIRTALHTPSLKLNIDKRDGFVTCLEGNDSCLFAATSSGAIYVFDVRFGMQSNIIRDPNRKRIKRLLYTPQGLFSSVKGNNEVSLFECERGSRIKALWASRAPVLCSQTARDSTPDCVLSMVSLTTSAANGLITAGTDMRLRYWDLKNAATSSMLSDGLRPHTNGHSIGATSHSMQEHFSYSSKFVDGIEVFLEDERRSSQSNAQASIEQQGVATCHKDCISDMVFIENEHNMLVTAAKDGVIKLWK